MASSSYVKKDNDVWYCLLPNNIYKEIPYVNWVEDIDWCYIYYKVYSSLNHEIITDDELFWWDLEKVLKVAADMEL